MPIQLTPFNHKPLCYGYTWTVNNSNDLAEKIAYIAMGQSLHVQNILAGANLALRTPTINAAKSAINLLTANNDKEKEHRDGWMFQLMSWIAANKALPNGLIKTPQMVWAQKGFDGLQLKLNNKNIVAAIIFEDKATNNPRKKIQQQVWPEFLNFEKGKRESELTAEIVSILQTQHDIDVIAAIENIIWKNFRHYRVSITIGDTHANDAGRKNLFKGYDTTITGNMQIEQEKRRAETFYVANLRNWMEQLAQKAITSIQSKVATHV